MHVHFFPTTIVHTWRSMHWLLVQAWFHAANYKQILVRQPQGISVSHALTTITDKTFSIM